MNSLLVFLVLVFVPTTVVCQGVLDEAAQNVTEAATTVQNLLKAGDLPEVGAIFATGLSEPALITVLQELVQELLVKPGIIVQAFVAAVSQEYNQQTEIAQGQFQSLMVSVFSNITDTTEDFTDTPAATLTSITFTEFNPSLEKLVADPMTDVVETQGCAGVGPLLDAGMVASTAFAQLYNSTLAQYSDLSDCYLAK